MCILCADISWSISKYLICIAAFVLSNSDDSFISLAVSTSACDIIIFAYDNLRCLAAAVRFFMISGGRIISVRQICQTRMPRLPSCCWMQSRVEFRKVARRDRMESRVDYPTALRMAAWAAQRMAGNTEFVPREQRTRKGLTVRKYTAAQTVRVMLSFVITICFPRCSLFNRISTSSTSSEHGLIILNPGLSILVNLPNCSTIPATQPSILTIRRPQVIRELTTASAHKARQHITAGDLGDAALAAAHAEILVAAEFVVGVAAVDGQTGLWVADLVDLEVEAVDGLVGFVGVDALLLFHWGFWRLYIIRKREGMGIFNLLGMEEIRVQTEEMGKQEERKQDQQDGGEDRPVSSGSLTDAKLNPRTALVSRTDQVFTFVLIAVQVALAFITLYSMATTMPRKLGMGFDFRGLICGQPPLQSKPYLYKLLPQTDPNLQICVSQCPSQTGPKICLYQPDGTTPTTFCYQSAQTIPQGYFCIQKEYHSRRTILQGLNQGVFVMERFLGNLTEVIMRGIQNLEEFGIAMAVVMLMVVLVNFMTLMMEAVVLRPMVFGSQVVLFGFAYLAYQKHTEEVQLRCINSIEKYGCAPGMFKGLFIMYIVLGFIYLFKVSQDWSKVKMGCMNISKSSQLHAMINKLGQGVYLSPIGLGWLFAFGLFSLNCTVTLYQKSLIPGQLPGGLLYTLSRSPSSIYLLTCSLFCLILITSTYLSLCQASITTAITKWYLQPTKQHSFLFDGFMTVVRYRLGSVCLHALLKCFVVVVEVPLVVISSIAGVRWIKCAWLKKVEGCLYGIKKKVAVENFVFAAVGNGGYRELVDIREELKRKKYNSIMEAENIVKKTIFYISLALGLIGSAVSYTISTVRGNNSEFLLLLPLIHTPATYLFVYTCLMRYDLAHRAMMLLGSAKISINSAFSKYCEQTLSGQFTIKNQKNNEQQKASLPI